MDFTSILNMALLFSLILGLGAISGFFSERVGIVNIGINGMMTFGALFYCIYGGLINGGNAGYKGGMAGDGTFLIPMLLSAVTTIIVGLLFGFAVIKLKADHIIAGTAINLLGASLGIFLNSSLGFSILGVEELRNSYTQILKIGETNLFGSTLILFFLIGFIVLGIWLFMKYTKFGLRFTSIGENPYAADVQGINVIKYQWIGLIISAAIAGLAGSIFMYNSTSFRGDVDSLGFLSLAIMIAGAWRIPLISLVSIVFAFLVSISKQTIPNVNSDLLLILPYAFTLLSLVVFSFFSFGSAPKHVGQHFAHEKV
ncbi:MAG: ABC transporter permease [Mycoplasmoidaceae bacterium]